MKAIDDKSPTETYSEELFSNCKLGDLTLNNLAKKTIIEALHK
jgi:hypothetical protein